MMQKILIITFNNSSQDLCTNSGSTKGVVSQFNKLGIISRAEFESQRGEGERHGVAGNEDDLQFDLDDSDKPSEDVPVDPAQPPANTGSDDSSSESKPRPSQGTVDGGVATKRDNLYWLENSARFYPVPIRPQSNTAKPVAKVTLNVHCNDYCILFLINKSYY